jgi:aspartokinase-like uncharacterized kinase
MTIVLKLGGSLLTDPELKLTLSELQSTFIGRKCLYVVGGGAATDVVRNWSSVHQLSSEVSHQLAIASMGLNRRFVESITGWITVCSRGEADEYWAGNRSPVLLDVEQFLARQETISGQVPRDWQFTSDSISAWVATHWPADELILLKSCMLPTELKLDQAADQLLVDSFFPQASRGIRFLRWCNVRTRPIDILSIRSVE